MGPSSAQEDDSRRYANEEVRKTKSRDAREKRERASQYRKHSKAAAEPQFCALSRVGIRLRFVVEHMGNSSISLYLSSINSKRPSRRR